MRRQKRQYLLFYEMWEDRQYSDLDEKLVDLDEKSIIQKLKIKLW